MVRYQKGDFVVAKMDIQYDAVFAGENDVFKGAVGQVQEILMNVQIQKAESTESAATNQSLHQKFSIFLQGVNLFCDDKDYTPKDLGMGYSTFLAVKWLSGRQKGKCLKTHQSNVKRITEEEAQYIIKMQRD